MAHKQRHLVGTPARPWGKPGLTVMAVATALCNPVEEAVDECESYSHAPFSGELFNLIRGRPHFKGGLGPSPEFYKLGLRLHSHPNAEFGVDRNVFTIRLLCDMDPLRVYADLVTFENNDYTSGKEVTHGGAFAQKNARHLFLHVAVPQEGWHKLDLYARRRADPSTALPHVFSYAFYVYQVTFPVADLKPRAAEDCMLGRFLYRPLFLPAAKTLPGVKFRVAVQGASKVIVRTATGGVTPLRKDSNRPSDGIWYGMVDLDLARGGPGLPSGARITIEACFGQLKELPFVPVYSYFMHASSQPCSAQTKDTRGPQSLE